MAEASSEVAGTAAAQAGARRMRRKFYVILAVLMAVLVVAGFWPSYYGPLLAGNVDVPFMLHLHGLIYAGWMALLIVQTTLAARGKIKTHRSVGNIGIAYGTVIWIMGVIVSFAAPAIRVTSGAWSVDEAAIFMPIPLGDMILFGGFFAAAVSYRQKPEIHKR
ncbi:MAG: hypothetical protein R3305_11015, partial [Gammaproteobacteria bacterium]|nr:hypothetical protein [Gammaproteobacteria bacterium]